MAMFIFGEPRVVNTSKLGWGITALYSAVAMSVWQTPAEAAGVPSDVTLVREIVNLVAPLGIGGVIAVFMFMWYRRDIAENRKDLEEIVNQVTQALVHSTKALEQSATAHASAVTESALTRQVLEQVRNELRDVQVRRWERAAVDRPADR